MRRAALFVVSLAAGAAQAETVAVRSGDHDGFARVVLQHDAPVDWTVARTATGYVFRPGRDGVIYDLADVWRLIGRDRLADIRPAAGAGGLELNLGCACHALPFEIRPGVVVIDIRDGAPPPGSSFELPEAMPPTADATLPVEMPPAEGTDAPGYDWLDLPAVTARTGPILALPPVAGRPADPVRAAEASDTDPADPVPAADAEPDRNVAEAPPADAGTAELADMRDALLRQVGRGMTQGILDPAEDLPDTVAPERAAANPIHQAVPDPAAPPLEDQIRIRDPDADTSVDEGTAVPPSDPGSMTADGAACLSDATLALQDWGDAAPPAQALGRMTTGMVGEFDRPEPEAVRRAVRYLLHLGFGAEARQLAADMAPQDPDRAAWTSLSRILDGATDPAGAFVGMEVCDTAAALWAMLAVDRAPSGPAVATGAVLRAFSALPPHLRRHLGPPLAERFETRGDAATVQAITGAILRAPGDPGAPVRLMEAERALAQGVPGSDRAVAVLSAAPGDTGVQATVTLLRDAAARGAAAPDSLLDAAEALRREYRGAPQEAELAAAIALARAVRAEFDTAFAVAETAPSAARDDVWALLASAPDSAVMRHAILAPGATAPPLPPETDRAIARRLLALGFPGPALVWVGPARRPSGLHEDDRLLMSEAALMRRDGAAALRALEGLDAPEAAPLRAQAAVLAGQAVPEDLPPDLQLRLALRERDWQALAEQGSDPWRGAAALATAPDGAATVAAETRATLAGARALLEESAAARATLDALLGATRP